MRALLALVPFFLGCGQIIIAYPPATLHAVDAAPVSAGHVAAGVGLSAAVVPGEEPAVLPDYYGGFANVDLGLGLNSRWDVGVDAAMQLQGVTWGGRAGYQLDDRWGLLGGISGAWLHQEYDETTTLGDAPPTTRHIDYTYGVFAPWLGARAHFDLNPHLQIPLILRVGGSFPYAVANVEESIDNWDLIVDVQSGLRIPLGKVALGVDVGALTSDAFLDSDLPVLPRFGLSFRGKIGPLWKPATR